MAGADRPAPPTLTAARPGATIAGMARAVDRSRLTPREARCHGCGQIVPLSTAARRRGRFRCPQCQTDNRVDHTGLGRPLSGPAVDLAEPPLTVCARCAAPNRLPLPLLRGRHYTCHHCRRVEPIPPDLRQRRTAGPAVLLVVLVGLALALTSARRQLNELVGEMDAQLLADRLQATAATLELTQGDVAYRRGQTSFTIGGHLTSLLDRPAALYVRLEIMDGDRLVTARLAPLLNVAPGTTRAFGLTFVIPRDQPATTVRPTLWGAS